MPFPKLLRTSEGLQRIPHPEDFGLESLIAGIFGRRLSDFTEEGRYTPGNRASSVAAYAFDLIERPETDTASIRSRQQVLEAFMEADGLLGLIRYARIPQKHETRGGIDRVTDEAVKDLAFENRTERARDYLHYVTELGNLLPETQNPELEAFRSYVRGMEQGERMRQLRTAIHDVYGSVRMAVSTSFTAEGGSQFKHDDVRVKATFESDGKVEHVFHGWDKWQNIAAPSDYAFSDKLKYKGLPLSKLVGAVLRQVKKNFRKDLSGTPVDLEVIADREDGTVTATVRYEGTDWRGSLRSTLASLRPKREYTTVTRTVNLQPELNVREFSEIISHMKCEHYLPVLDQYSKDISEFAEAAIVLRYMATMADYFNGLRHKGIHVTMPRIAEMGANRMHIKALVEPNLASRLGTEVVANDADSEPERNVFVITGLHNDTKTVYMNAIAMAQAMAQAGILVYAQDAELSPKDNIYTHCIRPGDLAVGESRHVHELSRSLDIIRRATRNSLILLDEPFTGTTAADGKQILDGAVRAIGIIGATCYVATHFHSLILTAKGLPYADNLHSVAGRNGAKLTPTYLIRGGPSWQSGGMYFARQHGADPEGLVRILTERAEKEGLALRQ